MKTVLAVCKDCGGTGLYTGFCEKKGHSVVCLSCNGSGCETISYAPFVKRKIVSGVKGVSLSGGKFIFSGAGNRGQEVSYSDFLDGKLKYT